MLLLNAVFVQIGVFVQSGVLQNSAFQTFLRQIALYSPCRLVGRHPLLPLILPP